jgi:hypothetical protein
MDLFFLQLFIALSNLLSEKRPFVIKLLFFLLSIFSCNLSLTFKVLIELLGVFSLDHTFGLNVFYPFNLQLSDFAFKRSDLFYCALEFFLVSSRLEHH